MHISVNDVYERAGSVVSAIPVLPRSQTARPVAEAGRDVVRPELPILHLS